MMKIINLFSKFFIYTFLTSNIYAAELSPLFYKAPTKDNLEATIKEHEKPNINPNSGSIIVSLFTIIFKTYPDLLDSIHLESYSKQMQKYLAQSIINNHMKEDLLTEYKMKPYNIDYDADYDSSVGSSAKMDRNMRLTDLLWTAYYATGDEKYLKKILQFLASHSLKHRTLAYEILNREALQRAHVAMMGTENSELGCQDIMQAVDITEMFDILSFKIVLWSMNSNRQQYPEIDVKVKALIDADSRLDYKRDVAL